MILSKWPRPLAFVLSGGGSYGATQAGMLQALSEHEIQPDMVIGTSVGALNGAMFAADPDTAAEKLAEIWTSMSRSELLGGEGPLSAIREVIRAGLHRDTPSVASLGPLGDLIDRYTAVAQIENLKVPLAVVVTDALAGNTVVITEGPLKIALQASAAIPGVFPPVEHLGRYFIDGGVTANVPVRQAIDNGAKSIIVLDCIPATFTGEIPRSVVGSLLHASHIMLRNQPANSSDVLTENIPILRLPATTPPDYHSFDFDRSEQLISTAYASSHEAIEKALLP